MGLHTSYIIHERFSYISPCKKVWFERWVESANEVHSDIPLTGVSGEGAGSLHGSVTMDTGSSGSASK